MVTSEVHLDGLFLDAVSENIFSDQINTEDSAKEGETNVHTIKQENCWSLCKWEETNEWFFR